MILSRRCQPYGYWAGVIGAMSHLMGVLFLALLLSAAPQPACAAEKLTICNGTPPAKLVALAKLRNLFAAEGLEADMRQLPSGRQCLEALFAGTCQIATVAETPLVHYSMLRNDFLILAGVSLREDFERILARSERGIQKPADLRGRSVGIAKFTAGHYFLDMFLVAHGMSAQDVKPVYLSPQELMPALKRGEVDAAVHWEPDVQNLLDEMGGSLKRFSAPGLHVSPFLLVGARDYVRKNPAVIAQVMRALVNAEKYSKEQPLAAQSLMSKFFDLGASEAGLDAASTRHHVTLDQSLPFLLENAARWEVGLMAPAQRPVVPNYLDFIYFDALMSVKPEAVTLIH